MTQHVVFLLLGLANGAVYAALALALTVTYRSSGVINFATGALSLLTAYMYAFLRNGQFLVLIPGLPKTVDLGGKVPFVPAVVIAVLFTSLFGLLLYLVIFRRLRDAPPVARAVASLGVMVVITAVLLQRLGTKPVQVKKIFPSTFWHLGSVRISQDRIYFAITVTAVAVVIAAAFRFTRFGLATRAAAETEKGAYVSGISPDRIAAFNWMIGAAVAGLSGILIAPITPLVPIAYTLFIVPALAATILGRFQLLIPAVLGGLMIGSLQSEATYLVSRHKWLPQSGLPEVIPLILILAVLVVRARPLPTRGAVIRTSLGTAPRPHRLLPTTVIGAAAGILALIVLQRTWRSALVTSLIFGIIGLSLVVVTGYAGQVSLAQLTLAGVAGFILGPLTRDWFMPFTHHHYPFPIAPLLAATLAAIIGVVVGLPAIRIRGLPVAIVTLALAVAVEALWFRNNALVGASGKKIDGPFLFGLDLRARVGSSFPRLSFCITVLVVLVGVAVFVAKLRTSRLGSEMLAVRANEKSAAASGIDVIRVKLVAFAIGSFIAGLGGAMLGYKQGSVTYDSFAVLLGLGLFGSVYLAGITSVSGGVLAGILGANGLVYAISTRWLHLGDWYTAVTGLGLIFTVVQNPEGIVGPIHTKLAARRSAAFTSDVPLEAVTSTSLAAEPSASPPVSAPPSAGRADLLSLRSISVRYGGVTAVDSVSLDIAEGSIVGLIGPNGAGKTTMLDAISGFAPSSGTVSLGGRSLEDLPPFRRTRAGLGRTFQAIELYDDLSVRENVVIGASSMHQAHRGSLDEAVDETLALLQLTAVAERPASELSHGRRQLVSIARALVGRPQVLLLDEPAGGLDTGESQWLGDRLRDIRASGVTIVLIDHDMGLVFNLCDTVHVLDFGKLIAGGTPSEVAKDRNVAEAYLGSTHAQVGS